MYEEILDNLNGPQREAVLHTEGPLLILAGAGSGKTRTIIHRIAYILKKGLAKPYQILALTFTNKAAGEMRERIASFDIPYLNEMWMGTFHSICARILRIHAEAIGYTRNFTIYDEDDSRSVIRRILKEMNRESSSISPAALSSIISKIKERILTPDEIDDEYYDIAYLVDVGEVYRRYCKILKESNAMDFDDLLMNTLLLLEANEDVLLHYQKRFRYILVDEYQDTNLVQYRIVAMIGAGSKNVCVCGDDDQSIYSWRGADIRNILEFELDFAQARTVRLEENYRSTQTVLDAANALISNNEGRMGKTLFTRNGSGKPIRVYAAPRDFDEASYVAKKSKELAKELPYNEIAVLYRVNSQSRLLEEAFIRTSVPYQIIGGIRFYDRMEVKDILSWLKLIVNPYDNIAFIRAASTPKRGIGDVTLEKLAEYAAFKNISIVDAAYIADTIPSLSKKAKENLFGMAAVLKEAGEIESLSDAVRFIVDRSGYAAMLKGDRDERAEMRLENLEELIRAASDFRLASEDKSMSAFLENAALIGSADFADETSGTVKLMTMHNAKGLEYDVIFITGMEENLFPLKRTSETEEGLEEERRLCYVALTRAKKHLFLTWARMRRLYGNRDEMKMPSSFLMEIPDNLIENEQRDFIPPSPEKPSHSPKKSVAMPKFNYRDNKRTAPKPEGDGFLPGEKVIASEYGEGTVITVEEKGGDRIVSVAFAGLGIKKFIDGFGMIKKA